MGAGHELCAFRKEGLEIVGREHRIGCLWFGCGAASPPFDLKAFAGGETDPGAEVGFVVDLGEDDLVAYGEVVPETGGEVLEELSC